MKILMVSGPATGGIQRVVEWLQEQRSSQGINTAPLVISGSWTRIPLGLRRLSQAVLDFRPDLIEAHGWRAGALSQLAARRLDPSLPVVSVIHSFPPAAQGRLWLAWARRLVSPSIIYVAVSPTLGRWLAQRLKTSVQAVPVLPPAEAVDRAVARRRLGLRKNWLVAGSTGRLTGAKGYDVLLRAWARCRHKRPDVAPVRLCIVGDGPDAARLRRLAHALGIDDTVLWLGHVPGASSLMTAFDLYVQPSRWEGAGLAVVEAGRVGIPVIASAAGGLVDLAGPAAVMVPPGNVEALARALDEALTWTRQERERRGQILRNFLTKNYPVPAGSQPDPLCSLYFRLGDRVLHHNVH